MNTEKKQRHARAMNLFEAEARHQQLSAIALSQAINGGNVAPTPAAGLVDQSHPLAGLLALDRTAETNILNAHADIHAARAQAAQMATADPELARINRLINGDAPTGTTSPPNVIDGEVTSVTVELVEPPPRIERR